MDNLIFSLNATFPIFLLMVLGYIFNKIGLMDEKAASWMNKFVFKVALPVLLFEDLSKEDFAAAWNGRFVLFCFLATAISVLMITLLSMFLVKNKGRRGEFIQGSYRSSAALLGIAFIHNIYGEAGTGMAPLMILGSVPLYNILAVIILMVTAPSDYVMGDSSKESSSDNAKKVLIKKTLLGILKNPIILGIFIGMIWSLLRIPQPKIFNTVVSNIASLATPLGLMSMGATFDFKKAANEIKPALCASFIKLFVLVAIFLPVAVTLGFSGEQLVAILVMLGSATTVSCFIMSKNMGHEGTLSSSIIMMTTFGCSFSLTFWLYILKSLSLI
ncbi:AEC family transporter [Butyrivibrio sp. DSM 10294]|uniref:AEC family transporter n=1 Tax=Butyrivibrio sp. DSM 10294 TaxID=2972457 RepID=UPI00234F55DB|nr:AEC family transporter [Butyrivibrio sp. DSM 10294]MDC7293170.1 AEC family transporter [Butyrivibrio sp. DSM 10294]